MIRLGAVDNPQKLPIALGREPLVDAICEVRLVNAAAPLVDLLPGVLFQAFTPKPTIQRTPAADVPPTIRQSDPALQYQPIIVLEMNGFYVTISDRSFMIGCRLPYPKWQGFKSKIVEIIKIIGGLGEFAKVERYSLKYVNIIEAGDFADQLSKVKLSIEVGGYKVESSHVNLQTHLQEENALHIITMMTGVNGQVQGGPGRNGVLVDIDSIRSFEPISLAKFAAEIEGEIESLRQSNKRVFFSCLKEETTASLEPVYA